MGKKRVDVEEVVKEALSSVEEVFGADNFETKIYKTLTAVDVCNTNAKAFEIRNLLESEEIEDYPSLDSLEDSWRVLSNYYGDWDGEPLISRVEDPDKTAASPMESFNYHVDTGFYPPPEIMVAIQLCFQKYLAHGGDISLDEAFFGKPHKKRESYAYQKNYAYKYAAFHSLFVVIGSKHRTETGQPQKSLEQLAEEYLSSLFCGDDSGLDIDTFLRGYRRWKNRFRKED